MLKKGFFDLSCSSDQHGHEGCGGGWGGGVIRAGVSSDTALCFNYIYICKLKEMANIIHPLPGKSCKYGKFGKLSTKIKTNIFGKTL